MLTEQAGSGPGLQGEVPAVENWTWGKKQAGKFWGTKASLFFPSASFGLIKEMSSPVDHASMS